MMGGSSSKKKGGMNWVNMMGGSSIAMKVVIDEIKKKLEVFTATIDELGQHVAKCSRDVRQARAVILQRIIKYP